ncbi:unnamed protein product [Owenia fusiformis]|uniref:Uncharacterized protein n=1 Tax=Owenia fusiformis TaxID=6347 RepID=A0A8J1U594_OWEFU|nr:unnamed protein product [Owenia fusiformis]
MDPKLNSSQESVGSCLTRCKDKKVLLVDTNGKATTFWLFSLRRPHMRAFHASWIGFFFAFLGWFCVQPLIPYIKQDLSLNDEEVANSGIAGVAAVVFVRIMAGPICDRFGARRVMVILLVAGSIPVGLAGLVTNGVGLVIVRLFIGILGGVFVPCQFWTISMFSSNIVGSANALAGGWGNLGGGVTFLLMPVLYRLISLSGINSSVAWKVTLVIPAAVGFILALPYWFLTDDCPQGPWYLRKRAQKNTNDVIQHANDNLAYAASTDGDADGHTAHRAPHGTSSTIAATEMIGNLSNIERNTLPQYDGGWRGHIGFRILAISILFMQYAASFGVEISVNSILNIYLLRRFRTPGCNVTGPNGEDPEYKCSVLTPETASLITSIFGLMNLFARFTGGLLSDILHERFNLSGRIMVHFVVYVLEGLLMIVFGSMETIPTAIVVLVLWSFCVQNAEGTTYSLIPFVWPERVGVVAGIVAAGGNLGGFCWNFLWRYSLNNMSQYFTIIGCFVILMALLNSILIVRNYHITDPLFKSQKFINGEKTLSRDRISIKNTGLEQVHSFDVTKL